MQERRISKRRVAAMNDDQNGEPLGVGFFLTPGQLAQLGIDPQETDVIEYHVEDGEISIRPGME